MLKGLFLLLVVGFLFGILILFLIIRFTNKIKVNSILDEAYNKAEQLKKEKI